MIYDSNILNQKQRGAAQDTPPKEKSNRIGSDWCRCIGYVNKEGGIGYRLEATSAIPDFDL